MIFFSQIAWALKNNKREKHTVNVFSTSLMYTQFLFNRLKRGMAPIDIGAQKGLTSDRTRQRLNVSE